MLENMHHLYLYLWYRGTLEVRSKLIELISMALVASDEELLEAETKKDIKSADFTQDEPMSFSEFMQKLMGMMEDKDEHGNKGT